MHIKIAPTDIIFPTTQDLPPVLRVILARQAVGVSVTVLKCCTLTEPATQLSYANCFLMFFPHLYLSMSKKS